MSEDNNIKLKYLRVEYTEATEEGNPWFLHYVEVGISPSFCPKTLAESFCVHFTEGMKKRQFDLNLSNLYDRRVDLIR